MECIAEVKWLKVRSSIAEDLVRGRFHQPSPRPPVLTLIVVPFFRVNASYQHRGSCLCSTIPQNRSNNIVARTPSLSSHSSTSEYRCPCHSHCTQLPFDPSDCSLSNFFFLHAQQQQAPQSTKHGMSWSLCSIYLYAAGDVWRLCMCAPRSSYLQLLL